MDPTHGAEPREVYGAGDDGDVDMPRRAVLGFGAEALCSPVREDDNFAGRKGVEGKTLLLGPQQQRQSGVRQFVSAVESTEVGLAATASLVHESAPERLWNPSEFLSQLYFGAHGKVLSQA